MTYCLALKVVDGLVCLADGRLTAGSQLSVARKASLHGGAPPTYCIMCSGLRSLRDKVMVYFEEAAGPAAPQPVTRLTGVLSHLSRSIRKAGEEDRDALERSGLAYDLHMIVAGQLADDTDTGLYLVYPEGNWISVDRRQPYLSIGATSYGKAVLDAVLRPETPVATVLKLAYLAFESTRLSSGDVGYPLDVLTFGLDRQWRQREFAEDDLVVLRRWWESSLPRLVETMPEALWLNGLLPGPAHRPGPQRPQARPANPAATQVAAKVGGPSQSK